MTLNQYADKYITSYHKHLSATEIVETKKLSQNMCSILRK